MHWQAMLAKEAVVVDLTDLAALISENEDVKSMVGSPAITWTEQMNAITAILEKASADALTVKFAGTVAQMGVCLPWIGLSRISRGTCPATWRNLRRGRQAVALDESHAALWKKLSAALPAVTKYLSQCALTRH